MIDYSSIRYIGLHHSGASALGRPNGARIAITSILSAITSNLKGFKIQYSRKVSRKLEDWKDYA